MGRILVVEDNEVNSRMISRRLEKCGYEVGIVEDGELAVQCTYHHMPDLVLMDMSLPLKDGWTATRELKGWEKTAKIPVIAVTAHATSEDRKKAQDCGCDDFVSKPIDFAYLREVIEKYLPS